MRRVLIAVATATLMGHAGGSAVALQPLSAPGMVERPRMSIPVAGCKTVSSCREAVIMWCNGYARADGDGDGIPCENVCSSRRQVQQIMDEIGC